ncbi:Quinol monooxygenase YgiN [Duganella sp. CF458]|uniref:putative quinol monooxygenase n=1 Tax=Duganella sp. CF458 TaxID=1884368 RepID=UPI0008F350FC|nr:putative quinol monooxygenase [Duganella sp. CF458]SFG78742.1 Quinol monooxygenase YgiN [Duganella sp. CF458]
MYLLAMLDVHPQFRRELLAGLDQLVAHSRTEPGTLQYEVLADLENENRIIVFERYTDAAAMQAHLESAPLQALAAKFATYLASPPALVRMTRHDGFLREGLAHTA